MRLFFVSVYIDHRFYNTMSVFILKNKCTISLQVDLVCNLLDIPVYKYVLYSFNSSCNKLVKEYFPFKPENKFIFINFINTHQSLYFKPFYPKSVKIILFKIQIMSSFKDFRFEYRMAAIFPEHFQSFQTLSLLR
jgi:hypothetical protein